MALIVISPLLSASSMRTMEHVKVAQMGLIERLVESRATLPSVHVSSMRTTEPVKAIPVHHLMPQLSLTV
jgi:hypothetical protein